MAGPANEGLDPFVAAVDVLSDAWTLLVVQESFFGARRFGDFVGALAIPKARLSERLRHLVEEGLLDRRPTNPSGSRYEYRLTDKGRAVYPVALALLSWSERRSGKQRGARVGLVHEPCGRPLRVEFRCRECGEPVHRRDLRWPALAPLNPASAGAGSVARWRQGPRGMAAIHGDPVIGALRVLGDRWSMLIMYGAQVTNFRFGEAQSKLGIATNILTRRLEDLTQQRVLEKVEVGGGHRYRATKAGLELLDAVLAARTWSLDWLSGRGFEWTRLLHEPCGTDLRVDCHCRSCDALVVPHDVSRSGGHRP